MVLRKANIADAKLYFEWVNDSKVRESALNKDSVQWDSHVRWFEKKLLSDSVMLILLREDRPVGQIRFDLIEDKTFVLDYSIEEKSRGQGLGSAIVEMGIIYLRDKNMHGKVLANVKRDNFASNKVFKKLSFDLIDEVIVNRERVNKYELIF